MYQLCMTPAQDRSSHCISIKFSIRSIWKSFQLGIYYYLSICSRPLSITAL